METSFTPFAALAGGALIGLAAVLLFLLEGRVAGVAGIASRLLPPVDRQFANRLAFIAGLVAAPPLWLAVTGQRPAMTVTDHLPTLIAGGLLVGFGTVVGSGCTSGHGVCGLSLLSRRSLVAVGVFMAAAAVTVFVVRHF